MVKLKLEWWRMREERSRRAILRRCCRSSRRGGPVAKDYVCGFSVALLGLVGLRASPIRRRRARAVAFIAAYFLLSRAASAPHQQPPNIERKPVPVFLVSYCALAVLNKQIHCIGTSRGLSTPRNPRGLLWTAVEAILASDCNRAARASSHHTAGQIDLAGIWTRRARTGTWPTP